MKTRKIAPILAAVLLALLFAVPTASQGDQIVVNDADEIREDSISVAQDLVDLISGVGPRTVVQYANELRFADLVSIPVPLATLLDQVSTRAIVQYANTLRHEGLAAVPTPLQTLLESVSDRIVLQSAKHNQVLQLDYPVDLFGDTTPPQISGIAASPITTDTFIIAWTTDEFADSTVIYRERPGVYPYPYTVSDPLYVREHHIILTGLAPGTTYAYRVRSADLSGNTATSLEYGLTGQLDIYLPLVLRNVP